MTKIDNATASGGLQRVSFGLLLCLGILLLGITYTGSVGAAAEDGSAASSDPRVLSWDGSSAGLDRIRLRAGNGAARVRAIDGEEIRVRLSVKKGRGSDDEGWRGALRWFFHSDYEDDEELKGAVELKVTRRGSTLMVSPLPHGRSRETKIIEGWELEVPRRFAVDLEMASAEVEVTGVQGGVELRMGHGEAEVDVPRGPLDLELTVGNLRARTGFTELGNVSVASRVGDTRVWWDGERVRSHEPPGPGSEFENLGEGPKDIEIRVEVGDATLRVE